MECHATSLQASIVVGVRVREVVALRREDYLGVAACSETPLGVSTLVLVAGTRPEVGSYSCATIVCISLVVCAVLLSMKSVPPRSLPASRNRSFSTSSFRDGVMKQALG